MTRSIPQAAVRATSMNSRRHSVASALAATGTAALAFDDVSPLRAVGGGVLASPAWLFLIPAALLLVDREALRRMRVLLACCGAILAIGAVSTGAHAFGAPYAEYGTALWVKAASVGGAVTLWLLVLIAGAVLVRAAPRALLVGACIALAIMLVGALLARVGVPALDAWPVIHSSLNVQQRVRSTRFEPSSLGAGLLVLSSLVVVLARDRRSTVLFVGLVAVTGLIAQSRGTWGIAAIAVLVALSIALGQRVLRSRASVGTRALTLIAGVSAALIVAGSLAMPVLLASDLWRGLGFGDASRGTSDATRAGWTYISLLSTVREPFGFGFAAYLAGLPDLIRETLVILSPSYPRGALSELRGFITATSDTGLSPKTLPTVAALYLGWPGLIAVIALIGGAIRSGSTAVAHGPARLAAALACVLVATTYAWSIVSWDSALVLGAVIGAGALPARGRRAAGRHLD